jgi:hypothetical protein
MPVDGTVLRTHGAEAEVGVTGGKLRFGIIIPLIIVAYTVVVGLLLKWVVDQSRDHRTTHQINVMSKQT